jgi:hypothetical protein
MARKPVSCAACQDTGFLVPGQILCPCVLKEHPHLPIPNEAMWRLTNMYCALHKIVKDLGYIANWNGERFVLTARVDSRKAS